MCPVTQLSIRSYYILLCIFEREFYSICMKDEKDNLIFRIKMYVHKRGNKNREIREKYMIFVFIKKKKKINMKK